jgi:hypothetical protein
MKKKECHLLVKKISVLRFIQHVLAAILNFPEGGI